MTESITYALHLFEEAAIKHAEATQEGDYKKGNINYDKVIKVVTYLKEQNKMDELLPFLEHKIVGVRVAAATFLLPKHEKEGIRILEEVSRSSDFYSFIAETTLCEWRKGNLKL